ncbi:MAG: amidohydrolase family protein [Deltaproteobacteria bacterium]|nr:amidohydrolase family protein [Deltaproteobacteria bacterium]
MNSKCDILLKSGILIDPINNFEGARDIGIKAGKIIAVAEGLRADDAEDVFDVSGRYVMPGVVDMHAHMDGDFGYKMLAMAGVTTALDMAGPVDRIIEGSRDEGAGINVATIDRLVANYNIQDHDPTNAQIQNALDKTMKKGSLGLKIMGGYHPLTPDATARAIQVVNDNKAYIAYHAGTTKNGSEIDGFLEAAELAGNNCLHIAHINSYCRGLVRPYMTETQEAINTLIAHPNLRSESYLSPMNGTMGFCENGVPVSRIARNCLLMGGYEPTERGLENAILEGWAYINKRSGGGMVLSTGPEAGAFWKSMNTDAMVSFPVNPAQPRYWLATAKRPDGSFVTDAISTDGGSIPRNVIISMGLSLVKMQALTMAEFVLKASINPGRILGLTNRGHLGEGAEADITVVDYDRQQAYMTIVGGKPVMYNGYVYGRGGNFLTTSAGVENVKSYGLKPILIDISQSAFYLGL